jgi:transposase-like protein
MWNPTTQQLEIVADMGQGGMTAERIASALGITPEAFTAWLSRLAVVRAMDPAAVEMLLYPPRPAAVPPPPPPRDPRIIAERIFEAASAMRSFSASCSTNARPL